MNVQKLLEKKQGIKLDIGCGANKQDASWVGMDVLELPGVDIVHDLIDIPYPLPDECVITAKMSHVLEHIPKVQIVWKDKKYVTINPLLMVMNEIWRIMKYDGQLLISVPHADSNGFKRDPTHASPLNQETWWYFDPLMHDGLLYNFYKPKPWKIQTGANGEQNLYYDPAYNMEVVLIKRRMDESYE